jgi:hypothetical protein
MDANSLEPSKVSELIDVGRERVVVEETKRRLVDGEGSVYDFGESGLDGFVSVFSGGTGTVTCELDGESVEREMV